MPKVMVSLPDALLQDIDREAVRRGTTRSALLATAARRELEQQSPADLDAALDRARAALRSAGSFESGELVRAERDR
jgi:metal-responsive CopG/Arc/MetJ family transcriptional regulator